jgi:hypothetical protein
MNYTHAITTRALRIAYRGGEITVEGEPKGSPAPAGTVFAINERFAAEYGNHSDFVLLDAATAAELLDAQARQRAALATEAAHVRAQREAAEQAEQQRQERMQALVTLALNAVPVPDELSE